MTDPRAGFSPAWLNEPESGDPWVWEHRDPLVPPLWTAFIGNGLLGLRIPAEGQGIATSTHPGMPPTGGLMHGLWSDDRLMLPPRWHALGYHDGQTAYRADTGRHHAYVQRLDMRTATLTTTAAWESEGRRSDLETVIWLSLSDPHLLCIRSTVVPHFDGEIAFDDDITGWQRRAHFGELMAAQWRFADNDGALNVQVRMGEHHRRLGVVARLMTSSEPSKHTTVITEDDIHGAPGIARRTTIAVRSGQAVSVVRYAALVADTPLTPDPLAAAHACVSRALADPAQARAAHEAAWAQRWSRRIDVDHPRLQRLVTSALYQCYAQVPASEPGSVGPVGLSGMHWHGRVFWDADLWVYPVVALLQPDLGRAMTDYRHRTLPGALRNAAARGYAGACYAWESCERGDEKVPAPHVHHQRHINACVALAQWWDYCLTGDEQRFRTAGAEVILATAAYWASRVRWDDARKKYVLWHIKCPDEFAGIQDNNAFTNYACVRNLQLAQRVCLGTGAAPDPNWQKIIDGMWIPMDEAKQRVLEHEGFNRFGEYEDGTCRIKQADATLLIYPFAMPMSEQVQRNTLDYYRSLYGQAPIMMATAIDGIADAQLGDAASAWRSLETLLPHFHPPFGLASERPGNDTVSFITGLGGFLQLVVMGFCGVRITEETILSRPCLPEPIRSIRIRGLHHRGVAYDLLVDHAGHHLEAHRPI